MQYDSSFTIIAVKLGKCDNFEDTFTKCDKNEDTPVHLGKSCLILIIYTFSQFFSVVWFISYNNCRKVRKMWQFWGYLYKMRQKWGYPRTPGKSMFNIDFYIFSQFFSVVWFICNHILRQGRKMWQFKDTFTMCDINEDTPVSLLKLCLILIFKYIFKYLVQYDSSVT